MAAQIGPEYQRLMGVIRERITAGEYPVGTRIPSTAELHEMTGVSVPVVRRAVDLLKADGILEGHPGKGVYVKTTPAAAESERQDAKALKAQLEALQSQVQELAVQVGSAAPDDIRESIGRLEVNLIDLYGKLGYDYPQDGARGSAKAASRHGRSQQ